MKRRGKKIDRKRRLGIVMETKGEDWKRKKGGKVR